MDASTEAFQRQKLVRHENLLWLIVAQGIVILPLLAKLPIWLWFVWLSAMVWRLRIHAGKLAYPTGATKFVLGCGCVVGLLGSYTGDMSVEPMVGFLVCAFVLKLLELRTRKDGLLLLFIGFIAVAAQFLFAQTFFTALYACLSCVVLVTAWQTIYLTRSFTRVAKLKSGAVLLLHAMPLMVFMFVIMPRVGPLWRVPMPQGGGHTGFSDSLAPGDLGNLVQSSGTAFRVTFNGNQSVAAKDMYWRGLVLDSFDGRTWSLDGQWDMEWRSRRSDSPLEGLLDYDIIVEPHRYRWLFSLAEPVKITADRANAKITETGLIALRDPLFARLQYSAVSVPAQSYKWSPLPPHALDRLLRLPAGYNPEAVQLAQSWTLDNSDTPALIQKALQWFNQSFYYTLQPPILGKHSVDEFLFDTKRGFCEHFASSFAVLMRAAGVPARVVVGYQGGTYNEIEDYWIISQSDAHAWVEVWFEDKGWQRIDPTSAVAPQRIERGIESALSEEDRVMVASGQYDAPQWVIEFRHRMDAAGYVWNRWVLSYDNDKQSQLLSSLLGGIEPWRIGLGFIAAIAFLLGLYMLLVIKPKWHRKSELQRAVASFDKRCFQLGLQRHQDESLATFAERLAEFDSKLQPSCKQIALMSQRALYADDKRCISLLIRALRQFPKV